MVRGIWFEDQDVGVVIEYHPSPTGDPLTSVVRVLWSNGKIMGYSEAGLTSKFMVGEEE